MECRWNSDGYSILMRGRRPYAEAHFCGVRGESVSGRLSFYDTPLGILVSAELAGEILSNGVYGFCLESEAHDVCMSLPVVYGKNGRAKGRIITERLRRKSLLGEAIFLRESRREDGSLESVIAKGRIESFGNRCLEYTS